MGSEFLSEKIANWARRNLKDELGYWLQRQWLSLDELREIVEGLKGEKIDPWVLVETEHRSFSELKATEKGRKTFDFIKEV